MQLRITVLFCPYFMSRYIKCWFMFHLLKKKL